MPTLLLIPFIDNNLCRNTEYKTKILSLTTSLTLSLYSTILALILSPNSDLMAIGKTTSFCVSRPKIG